MCCDCWFNNSGYMGLGCLLEGLWVLVGKFRVISLFQLLQDSKHLENKITV